MSQIGYGSSGYLTRFEDYYKSSSDDSDDEEDIKQKDVKPVVNINLHVTTEEQATFKHEQFYESEEETDYFPPQLQQQNHDVNEEFFVTVANNEWVPSANVINEEVVAPSKDWVPSVLNDLKMTIIPPKDFKGYQEGAYPENVEEQQEDDEEGKTFSNDYADVCKFRCNLCGLDIDTEKLRSHINTNHEGSSMQDTELDSNRPYSVKTHHKCQICSKVLLFTRVRLRYHIINDHNMAIQDYNEQYMSKRVVKSGNTRVRRASGNNAESIEYGDNDVDPATVKEEEISSDYADIVKIHCKICEKPIEKDNFRFLHLKRHGMDMEDYKVAHGEPEVVKNSYHRCHICQTIFVFTRSRLAGHLARHKISVREYGKKYLTKVKTDRSFTPNLVVGEIDTDCMFSNDYEDECQTICKICDRSLNYGNLGSHLYQSHSTRMKDYVDQYGEPEINKKSYHECAICHETLLFIRYHLVTHVKTKHNMTITQYNKAHMQLHNVEYGDSNLLDKGRKIGTQKAPQWCDGTMYKCPYCFNIYYRYFTFRIHLINSHKMTDTEERSQCVKENEILTDIYRCKICSTQVKRDRMDIEAHLKQAHKTTLKIYSANFENPNLLESPEAVISKLVRMGVLEEPSKSICRTPKKLKPRLSELKSDNEVPVNENLNKFVSVSENVPLEKMTHVEIKTEVDDSNYFGTSSNSPEPLVTENRVLNEQDLERGKRKRKLPSKLNSDFEVKQVKSQTHDKPSTSGPLTQRNENTSHVSSKSNSNVASTSSGSRTVETKSSEEESVMYRCPLHPCTWTCGKEGMRQGPAVLHLLKVHRIQPLEMREKGIKFDKIQI